MGNSVGFYAVSRDLGSSKAANGSDLNLLTDPVGASNVQRLSVTHLDLDGDVTLASSEAQSDASLGSRHSVQSCSEERVPEAPPVRGVSCGDTFRPLNAESWRDIDSDASSQQQTEVSLDERLSDPSRRNSASLFLEPPLDASERLAHVDRKRQEHYIPLQSTKVIESLLLELQEGDPTLLSPSSSSSPSAVPLKVDLERDRPIVYTATNAADWRLGTILEESGSSLHKPCDTVENDDGLPMTPADRYDTSDDSSDEDDDGLRIGSVVNATDIEAEREKEEGIQLCLEPYEDKIERLEEYLHSSHESHTASVDRRQVEGHSRRQSSVDVSAVIGGNHNITYLHFGSGLEDDVTRVVAPEYDPSGGGATSSSPRSLVSEIHLFIDDPSRPFALTRQRPPSPPPEPHPQPPPLPHPQPPPRAAPRTALPPPKEDVDRAEEVFQEAVEVTEATESWGQALGRPPSATGVRRPQSAAVPDHSESSGNQLAEEMSHLRVENEKLLTRNRSLQREVEELRRVKTMMEEDVTLKPQINQMTMELTHAKEALSALKADRKRLKAEKFDLLNQMKQLYATLEDKEKELRDFIRNYEQRMKDSDESLRQLASERDETEREKWNILKHARDESERVVKLSAELGHKENTIRRMQEELEAVRKQLLSLGYQSDAESVRTNGLPTPTASTPACSPLPISTPTPTPNGRGSSADSGVRLSSDRDSTASHEVSLRGDDRPGDHTPTGAPTHSAASLNSSAISGLAASSASAGGLSRSAEQLCERLAEAAESSKVRGCSTLSRKGHKGGGTWGSISRVFARQKKRAALDASLYDGGNASDKRASWSPGSSLCASPLTEESYSEKLRLLEEAQHVPLERWKAPTVLAWLEVTLGMPQYGAMCAENIRSGKVLLELSDSELESGLGIAHPMHRKKLRLAIEELREPRLSRFPKISVLNHTWVSSEWLPDLGLPQYAEAFANNLVDGRLLEALTKKELEKHLGVHRKFHQASIIHGVHLLRIVRFDRQMLAERRRQCENVDCDPVVWTNVRWVRWARSVDLAEYADNLKDSGVHGALVVLESSFTADTMATALGIPQSKNIIRRHLATEMEALVNPARKQLEEQARFAKMERRRQEKLAAGGSLGRSFSRSYGTGLEKGDKDKRRASLRGSLSRALGLRLREEAALASGSHNGDSSSSGGQSPAVCARTGLHQHPHHTRPRSSVMPSAAYVPHETHRRVKSIGDIETITVTPV